VTVAPDHTPWRMCTSTHTCSLTHSLGRTLLDKGLFLHDA